MFAYFYGYVTAFSIIPLMLVARKLNNGFTLYLAGYCTILLGICNTILDARGFYYFQGAPTTQMFLLGLIMWIVSFFMPDTQETIKRHRKLIEKMKGGKKDE